MSQKTLSNRLIAKFSCLREFLGNFFSQLIIFILPKWKGKRCLEDHNWNK